MRIKFFKDNSLDYERFRKKYERIYDKCKRQMEVLLQTKKKKKTLLVIIL